MSQLLIKTKNELSMRKTYLIKGDQVSIERGQLVRMLWQQTLSDESEAIKFCRPRQQKWSLRWEPSINDNIDLHMSRLGNLVPEGPWCVFYATRCQVYWSLTHNVAFYCYSDLISHTLKHKHTHHIQGSVDWHTHINIYLHHLLYAHSSYLYYIKRNE